LMTYLTFASFQNIMGKPFGGLCMTRLHCQHLKADIDHYIESTLEKMVDKMDLQKKMVDKYNN